MIRPLECFIGLRYLRAGRGRGPVSFMSLVSFLGLGLGVAALIVILSAMNGLESEARTRLLSLSEHITLRSDRPGTDFDALANAVGAVEGVQSVTPFVRLEAMLSTRASLKPVAIRGILPAAEGPESDIASVVGIDRLETLVPGENRLLLGRFLAADLRLQAGDAVTVWRAEVEAGRPRPRQAIFTVAGTFDAGSEALDTGVALTHLADAGRLVGLDGEPEGLAIRLDEPMNVLQMQARLTDELGTDYGWSNWADENRTLFQAMSNEKIMTTILLLFIAGIAAFNIVASLTMVVNEKEKDIAILRTMGLEPRRLTRVFLLQGMVIGAGGALAGAIVGVLLALNLETILPWLEQTLGFQIMPGDVYYVTRVPSEVHLSDVLLIPGIAMLMALFATVYPARRAARIEPADVLRYD